MKRPWLLSACWACALSTIAFAEEPWRRHTIDDTSRGADGVRLADVNGDGRLDIATGWEEGGVIRVYLNPGPEKAKRTWPAVTVGRVKSPEDAVLVDLDGDGSLDVVSSCEGKTRSMYVHWAPPDRRRLLDEDAWQTEPLSATAGKQMWMFCLPLDIDGRSGVDLVAGAKGSQAQVGWLQSPDDPRDLAGWRWHPLYQAGWIMSLVAHDLDGDGDRDIVVSDRKGRTRGVLWLENPGAADAAGSWNEHRLPTGDVEPMFLDVADLDGDQREDILVATLHGGVLFFQRQTENSIEFQRYTIEQPTDTGRGKAVCVGDIDLDGKQDVVLSFEQATPPKSGVVWLAYDKSPREPVWRRYEVSGPEGIKYDLVELLDLDADGDLDILTCEERANLGVIWYENPSRS